MQKADSLIAAHSSQTLRKRLEVTKSQELAKWLADKPICECCGKVMTNKYGSGRFCSKSCANTRERTDATRIKISETLRGRPLSNDEKLSLLLPKHKRYAETYSGPELPTLDKEPLPPGFFPRTRMSYAEQFWGKVLTNNNISYKHDFVIQKPTGQRGVFRLDFLVGNIDIEIDGSQHLKQELKDKDARRDQYLQDMGYIVYRIKWVNPHNDINKQIVNQQINELLSFITIQVD